MSPASRIANIVDEICRRQDQVLRELDRLDQEVEQVLLGLTKSPEPAPVPVPVHAERKAA